MERDRRSPSPYLVTVPFAYDSYRKHYRNLSKHFHVVSKSLTPTIRKLFPFEPLSNFPDQMFHGTRIREITLCFVENSGALRFERFWNRGKSLQPLKDPLRAIRAENFQTYSKGKQRDSGVKQFHEMTVYSIPCLAGHESKLILPGKIL